jgi:AcrR family transcriptional regulator
MIEGSKRAPGRPRSAASRDAILDAAFWQTMERGYAAVTAETIAKAAGAGKQTLYRWWPTKAAIVLDAFAEKARARIDRVQEEAIRTGDLLTFLRAASAAYSASAPVLRHLIAEAQSEPALRVLLRDRLIEPRREALRRVLEPRIADAEQRETVVAALYGALWYRLLFDETLDDSFISRLAALVPTQKA